MGGRQPELGFLALTCERPAQRRGVGHTLARSFLGVIEVIEAGGVGNCVIESLTDGFIQSIVHRGHGFIATTSCQNR